MPIFLRKSHKEKQNAFYESSRFLVVKVIPVWLIIMILLATNALAHEKLVFSSIAGAYPQKLSELVLQKAYNKINVNFTVDWLPPARSLMLANNGHTDGELSRIDLTMNRYKNLIKIKIPINYIEGVAFTKSQKIHIENWNSLKPYLIGINKGTIFAEQATAGMKVQYVSSFASLFDMLDQNRVDVALAPRLVGLRMIAQHQLKEIHVNKPYLERLNLYHYLNKKHAELAIKLEQVLQEMENSGEIEAIRQSFINNLDSSLSY